MPKVVKRNRPTPAAVEDTPTDYSALQGALLGQPTPSAALLRRLREIASQTPRATMERWLEHLRRAGERIELFDHPSWPCLWVYVRSCCEENATPNAAGDENDAVASTAPVEVPIKVCRGESADGGGGGAGIPTSHGTLPPPPRRALIKVPLRDPMLSTLQCGVAAKAEAVTLYYLRCIADFIPPHRVGTHWLAQCIREVASGDLGSVDRLPSDTGCAIALDEKNRVVGICAVTQISEAYRLRAQQPLPTTIERWASDVHELEESPGTDPGAAICGVLLIWVASHLRGLQIATDLVDVARKRLVYRLEVPRERCAFSQPTRDGKLFAARYVGRLDFLAFL